MSEVGLDGRHRDRNGRISRKHGNTVVGTLRKIYGSGFAKGYPDSAQLKDVLQGFDSLHEMLADHDRGDLDKKVEDAVKQQ